MKINRWSVCFVVALLVGSAMPASMAMADESSSAIETVPKSMTHQGRLVDDNGHPIVGDVELTYTFYTDATDGEILWQDVVEVTVDTTGYYAVELGGDDNPIDATVVAGGEAWLGVAVDDDPELEPRISLNSVPYALATQEAGYAEEAEYADTTDEAIMAEVAQVADEASFADAAGHASTADEAGYAELAGGVEDGSIGTEALAEDFEVAPELIDEVTGQTLGGMSCSSGDVARYDGESWICDDPTADLVADDDGRLADARPPTPESEHYIQNAPDESQDASFDIDGQGAVGGELVVGDAIGVGIDDPGAAIDVDGDVHVGEGLDVDGPARFHDDVGIGVSEPPTPLAVDGNITADSLWTRQYSVRASQPDRLLGPDGEELDRFNGMVQVVTRSTSFSPIRLYLVSNVPGEDWCDVTQLGVVSPNRATGPVVECDANNHLQVRLLTTDSRDYTVTATIFSAAQLQ